LTFMNPCIVIHLWKWPTRCTSFSRRWTSFSWKFWPSQRSLSVSLDPGRRLSSFRSSFGNCPV
jgi:hypothetical protein